MAAALLLLVVTWGIVAVTSGHEVRRNVRIAGQDVGGMNDARLAAVMDTIDAKLAATPVAITTGGPATTPPSSATTSASATPATTSGATASSAASGAGGGQTLSSTLGALGVSLDREATAKAAFAARGNGFVLFRPFSWLGTFLSHSDTPVDLNVDADKAGAALEALGAAVRTEPAEPSLAYLDGTLRSVPGRAGARLDVAPLVAQLGRLDGDRLDGSTVTLQATLVPVAPKQSDDTAAKLLDQVNQHLDRQLEVSFGEEQRTLDASELEPFVSAQLSDGGKLTVKLADAATLDYLAKAFADVGKAPAEPELRISGGKVVVDEGEAGTICCAPTAVATLARAIEQGETKVDLALAPKAPDHDAAYYQKLGVKELVATFTTPYACCAPRVQNIHRMADIVGAHVIAPGETFSLNDTVGRRTTANGFVSAPVIDGNGNFDEDVGGGVSQFSTTLFNAAFFAGLEIDEYMAHGLYISRYPYGREATLSFPSPDLKIRNITPYGVLIWPTYTDTSITVSLYSTKYINAEQSGQSEAVYGAVCTQVTTLRSRTWIDTGKTETDKFYALYGPAEGVQCDGSKVLKPGETTTTATTATTAPGPPPSTDTTLAGGTTTTAAGPNASVPAPGTTAPPTATTKAP